MKKQLLLKFLMLCVGQVNCLPHEREQEFFDYWRDRWEKDNQNPDPDFYENYLKEEDFFIKSFENENNDDNGRDEN